MNTIVHQTSVIIKYELEDFDTELLRLIEDKKFEHNTHIINHKMFKVDLCVIKWLPYSSACHER